MRARASSERHSWVGRMRGRERERERERAREREIEGGREGGRERGREGEWERPAKESKGLGCPSL